MSPSSFSGTVARLQRAFGADVALDPLPSQRAGPLLSASMAGDRCRAPTVPVTPTRVHSRFWRQRQASRLAQGSGKPHRMAQVDGGVADLHAGPVEVEAQGVQRQLRSARSHSAPTSCLCTWIGIASASCGC